MSSLPDELASLLSAVRTPGDFHAEGTVELRLPGLVVDGVGPIALPLLPLQAEQLIAVARRAPYGRGAQTLVDTAVRRTWQIGAERVRIEGKGWARTLATLTERAAAGLGVGAPITLELYKLLIYDQGSHFVSHRDTEKARGMFATLIVTLPSAHEGGELVVRHRGREVRLDVRSDDPSEVAFAAFYADCVHEVLPVTSGCRIALVYKLLRVGEGSMPMPPNHEREQARVEALLRRWGAGKNAPDDDTPEKLVFLLEHAYTPAELSFPSLKGADAAKAAVLAAAARRSDCDLHVALLTIEEGGWAEHTGDAWSSRWRDVDDEDEDAFEIGEVLDSRRTLSDWGRSDGSPVALGELPVDDSELAPSGALADLDPDEQHFHEATGNEGASFERSYRRAALVLWPMARRLAVLSQAGLPVTLPYLDGVIDRWVADGELRESPLCSEARELAGHMLCGWRVHDCSLRDESDGARMLALMTRLNDKALVESVIVDVIATGRHAKSDNDAIRTALALLPVRRGSELVRRIIAANARTCPGSCADLLAHCARIASLAAGLAPAARALLEALPGDPGRMDPLDHAWQRQRIDADLVVDVAVAFSLIDARLADAAVSHLLAWPEEYGLDVVILPATRRLIGEAGTRRLAAVEVLRAACLSHLHLRGALALEAPRDWSRAPAPGCPCRRCGDLSAFLVDPARRTWVFKASEPDRRHVEQTLRRERCDVDFTTDKRGRPYSLVCTKNQASYDARLAQRKRDLQDLALLR